MSTVPSRYWNSLQSIERTCTRKNGRNSRSTQIHERQSNLIVLSQTHTHSHIHSHIRSLLVLVSSRSETCWLHWYIDHRRYNDYFSQWILSTVQGPIHYIRGNQRKDSVQTRFCFVVSSAPVILSYSCYWLILDSFKSQGIKVHTQRLEVGKKDTETNSSLTLFPQQVKSAQVSQCRDWIPSRVNKYCFLLIEWLRKLNFMNFSSC